MKPNRCSCGSERPKLQDHGEFAFVKCPECGEKTEMLADGESALASWNAIHQAEEDRPATKTVSGSEYLEWCRRALAGELRIHAVEVVDTSYWRLTLSWPDNV